MRPGIVIMHSLRHLLIDKPRIESSPNSSSILGQSVRVLAGCQRRPTFGRICVPQRWCYTHTLCITQYLVFFNKNFNFIQITHREHLESFANRLESVLWIVLKAVRTFCCPHSESEFWSLQNISCRETSGSPADETFRFSWGLSRRASSPHAGVCPVRQGAPRKHSIKKNFAESQKRKNSGRARGREALLSSQQQFVMCVLNPWTN